MCLSLSLFGKIQMKHLSEENKLVVVPEPEVLSFDSIFTHHLKLRTLDYFPSRSHDEFFDIKFFMAADYLKLLEIVDWINENLNSLVWMRFTLGFGFRFLFYDEKDAIHFKLTWIDYINEKP